MACGQRIQAMEYMFECEDRRHATNEPETRDELRAMGLQYLGIQDKRHNLKKQRKSGKFQETKASRRSKTRF
jgi:hypothetical protein